MTGFVHMMIANMTAIQKQKGIIMSSIGKKLAYGGGVIAGFVAVWGFGTKSKPYNDFISSIKAIANVAKENEANLNDSDKVSQFANTIDKIDFEGLNADAQITDAFENTFDAKLIKAEVVRVVDGDTLVVSINNEQRKVRLIGVDTPESVASQEYLDRTGKQNTEEGFKASDYTKALLANYPEVYLEYDAQTTDKYGRDLCYVWLEQPANTSIEELQDKMLNAMLLDAGWAQIATYPPNVKYVDTFTKLNNPEKAWER